jgi:enoyl-[acyl-carrier protein] reductase II
MELERIVKHTTVPATGIKYPVFPAGMGFVAHAEFAAAVSNAGGLGCLGSGSMTVQELKTQIRR